ncbi:MAG: carbonic anhydrase [Bacteroidota bacterium]|nr:carbonic anhydrase [Bacteroidota bacterium]
MKRLKTLLLACLVLSVALCNAADKKQNTQAVVKNSIHKIVRADINTPDDAILELKNGNKRFLLNKPENINYKEQIEQTKGRQKPLAAVLTCMDSRVPPEIIFDQGIGNVFSIRVAGNIEDEDILGSMEYATEHAGAKVIVVLGHTHCGAVTGAVQNVKLGNLTHLLEHIRISLANNVTGDKVVDETAKNNVKQTIKELYEKSEILHEMVEQGKLKIVGALYDIETGKVAFME